MKEKDLKQIKETISSMVNSRTLSLHSDLNDLHAKINRLNNRFTYEDGIQISNRLNDLENKIKTLEEAAQRDDHFILTIIEKICEHLKIDIDVKPASNLPQISVHEKKSEGRLFSMKDIYEAVEHAFKEVKPKR